MYFFDFKTRLEFVSLTLNPASFSAAPLTGLASWPIAFTRPSGRSLVEHMPSVISIILDNAASLLATPSEALLSSDTSIGVVFGIVRLSEPHFFGVVVQRSKGHKVDATARFLPGLCMTYVVCLFVCLFCFVLFCSTN